MPPRDAHRSHDAAPEDRPHQLRPRPRQLPLPKISARDCTESVGVIGSGPASLSFAYQMARRGYPVTIYEKRELPGGMLRHAIPEFRLPQQVLDAEIQRILDLQIALLPGIEAGNEISFPELKARHRLLFLGMGAQSARRLGIEGEAGPGVMSGIKYLTNRKLGIATGLGRRVVVVGGGNTVMDAARSARRDGAEVTLLYPRSLEEMRAEKHEVQDAEAEGVRFEFLCAPGWILRDEQVWYYLTDAYGNLRVSDWKTVLAAITRHKLAQHRAEELQG